MRVAALFDIHGNLPALEAVLEEVRNADVDRIVVGGDVLPGPMPTETLQRLSNLDVPAVFIRGNGDREVVARARGIETGAVPVAYRPMMAWVAEQLRPEDEQWLTSWPLTLSMNVRGMGDVLFCHATPRDDNEIFTKLTPEDQLLRVFAGIDVPLVVCGHTHMPFDRMVGRIRVVNAGSVGMPFCGPGADWLLLGPDVELRHTDYDLEAAAARIRATRYPQAEELVVNNILKTPAEADMLKAFANVPLK
jgi:putative phosphoesterase